MLFTWFSVLGAVSFAVALPASVYPVRPYVFLAPDLPKFVLQPTVKLQTPSTIQQIQPIVDAKSDLSTNKQYVLVYPAYQYYTTRQDDTGNAGFFEAIQNYFVNFGNSQTQSDESSQIMDAVEPDKQQQAANMADATRTSSILSEKINPTPSESKQKFVYSYITPASTVPLNADRRLFYLAEQPQVLGTFSGSPINPVFNFQPAPLVLSRSNVAQQDEPQPNKVITENVQKFSQIPPVMASVEQTPQAQGKSNVDSSDSVVVDAVPVNRVAPVIQPVENSRVEPLPAEPTEQAKIEDVGRSNTDPKQEPIVTDFNTLLEIPKLPEEFEQPIAEGIFKQPEGLDSSTLASVLAELSNN